MSKKIWFELVIVVSLFLSGIAVSYYGGIDKRNKAEIQRLEDNNYQKDLKISQLKLTEKEIRFEIQKKEGLLSKADSTLKKYKYKIKNLERLTSIKIKIDEIKDPDTIYLDADTIFDVVLKKYIKPFKSDSGCIKIEGFVTSTDPDTRIALTKKSVVVGFMEIDVKRKWYEFWKPRKEKILSSDCSNDIELIQIDKVK